MLPNIDILGNFFVFVHHLLVFFIVHKFSIVVVIVVVGSICSSSTTSSSSSSTTHLETKEKFKQSSLGSSRDGNSRNRKPAAMKPSMILDEMEFLFGVNFSNLAPDIEISHNLVHFFDLFFHFCEDGCAVEGATDRCVPISAMFAYYVIVSVKYELVIGLSFRDQEYEFIEQYVIFIFFFKICVEKHVHSRCCS